MAYRSVRSGGGRQPGWAAEDLAQGLGWFSIGLGLAEVLAPGALARTLGMRGSENLLRAYGVREIATGVAILSSRDPAPWVWGRVAGDALDIATLAPGLDDDNPQRANVGLALAAVAGVTALDLICAQALTSGRSRYLPPRRRLLPMRDYSRRTGFPRNPRDMRGAAGDFETPRDFRIPEALRPYTSRKYRNANGGATGTAGVGSSEGLL